MGRRAGARRFGIVAGLGQRLWTKLADRPVDSTAILGAAAASLVIVVNAVFLQSGPHPAPFFANPPPAPPSASTAGTRPNVAALAAPKPPDLPVARPTAAPATIRSVSARGNDPIGELIGSSIGSPARVLAVQRILSDFGYGQLKLSGVLDGPTSAAIERFESEHKLPLTGRLSDRLLNELAAMTGRPVE